MVISILVVIVVVRLHENGFANKSRSIGVLTDYIHQVGSACEIMK